MRLLSLSEASIQPRTSPPKFARSPCTDPQVEHLITEVGTSGNDTAPNESEAGGQFWPLRMECDEVEIDKFNANNDVEWNIKYIANLRAEREDLHIQMEICEKNMDEVKSPPHSKHFCIEVSLSAQIALHYLFFLMNLGLKF